ncbi:MAG TPA: hypothetical protein DDY59_15860 [Lachnospiraceae bacterium]|jgi:hypothetical protein|nr:hypothetical protein [Lachnospiraceae bacterium]HCA69700.1 hypothetical protein [Lachnospiraceae bacterium]
MKVKLDDVIDALDFTNPETQYYYSIKTEEILMVWDGMVNGKTDPELIEEITLSFDEYIALPSQYEINEYGMMEEFVENLPDGRKKIELSDAIQGRGAFRRFKDTVYDLGLEQKWYKFRDEAYEQVARNWCEENEIEIVKDK